MILPFDEVSPTYTDWARTKTGLRLIRFWSLLPFDINLNLNDLTLNDLCLEIENGNVLLIRNVGKRTVLNNIEAIYEDGFVSTSWYNKQIERYS